jgi:ABC-type amino acid transport system permease subunit
MTLLIMAHADLKTDALIVLVAAVGGLVIEAWGTQTNLWFYYTAERPPLWIVPAWPIATLSIDRLTRFLNWGVEKSDKKFFPSRPFVPLVFKVIYWLIFAGFFALMLVFVAPTVHKLLTVGALLLCAGLILTPTNYRSMVLTFIAGAGLGYFLELWGTTRQCWTYYTFQTPPLFAVLAHGMAAVTFWRTGLLVKLVWGKLSAWLFSRDRSVAPDI